MTLLSSKVRIDFEIRERSVAWMISVWTFSIKRQVHLACILRVAQVVERGSAQRKAAVVRATMRHFLMVATRRRVFSIVSGTNWRARARFVRQADLVIDHTPESPPTFTICPALA